MDEGFQRHRVEDFSHGIAHGAHRAANRAGFRVRAIVTRLKSGAAGAANGGQRSIERAHNLPDEDFAGGFGKRITTRGPLLRTQKAAIAQFQKDRVAPRRISALVALSAETKTDDPDFKPLTSEDFLAFLG